jgi:hypothetical protein
MSRTITMSECRTQKIEIDKIYPDGGTPYLRVTLHYEIMDDSVPPVPITYKQITQFSSEAGLPGGRTLPPAWEATFETLVSELETKLDVVEQL